MSTAEEMTSQDTDLATAVAAPRTPSIHRDPLGSLALINSGDRNPFSSTYAQQAEPSKASNNQNENPPTLVEDNPMRYVFKTPPPRSLSFGLTNTERPTYTPSSKTSAETASDSTVTKIRKESQAAKEDFRTSLAQLSQVHSRLARENGEHAMRADAIMRDMNEMRKGLLEIQKDARTKEDSKRPWPP